MGIGNGTGSGRELSTLRRSIIRVGKKGGLHPPTLPT